MTAERPKTVQWTVFSGAGAMPPGSPMRIALRGFYEKKSLRLASFLRNSRAKARLVSQRLARQRLSFVCSEMQDIQVFQQN